MSLDDGCDPLRIGLVVEQHIAAAVHLGIDEPRGEPSAIWQLPEHRAPSQSGLRGNTDNPGTLKDHGAVIVQP
jgi:hypothetical protein